MQMGKWACVLKGRAPARRAKSGREPAGAQGGGRDQGPGGGRAGRPRGRPQPDPSRAAGKHTFCINYKTRELNDRPFRRQAKTLTARPQIIT